SKAAAPCTLPYDDGQSSPVADISPHLIVLFSAFPISSQEKSYFSSTVISPVEVALTFVLF
ncbi:hypothetical protein ACQ4DH_004288, partial [Escherichia coli]